MDIQSFDVSSTFFHNINQTCGFIKKINNPQKDIFGHRYNLMVSINIYYLIFIIRMK